MPTRCTFRLNGRVVECDVNPRITLADLLRDEFGLTGTHLGCEHGVCGACSVLVDGCSARACLLLAVQVDGAEIVTIEGVRDDPDVRALSAALSERHGLQCGFCTPGMIISAIELLRSDAMVTDATVREHLSGNICRCTGYQGIAAAVVDTVGALRAGDATTELAAEC